MPARVQLGRIIEDAIKNTDPFTKKSILSRDEVEKLGKLLSAHPELKKEAAAQLKSQVALQRQFGPEGQKEIGILPSTLDELNKLLGVDLKDEFFVRQGKDAKADHALGVGLEKTAAADVESTHDPEAQREASQHRLEKQKAVLDSTAGNEGQPVGSRMDATKAKDIIKKELARELRARAPEELVAVHDAIGDHLEAGATKVIAEMHRSGTLRGMGNVGELIKTDGFIAAVKKTARAIGKDVVKAANLQVNRAAVDATVSGATKAVEGITAAAKGTKLEAVVAQQGPKAAAAITTLAKAGKTAEAAVQGTEAVVATAKVATVGAKAATQEVPIAGQVVGIAFAGAAAIEVGARAFKKPRDPLRFLASLGNLAGQIAGIFVPVIGGAVTVAKAGVDAYLNKRDEKAGKPGQTSRQAVAESAQATGEISASMSAMLEGAGYHEAAGKMREFLALAQKVGEDGITPTEQAKLDQAKAEVGKQLSGIGIKAAEEGAAEHKGTVLEASFHMAGNVFQQLFGSFLRAKNVDAAKDPKAERDKLATDAVEAAQKMAAAQAVAEAADKPAA